MTASAAPQAEEGSQDPAVVGQWSPVREWPIFSIHANLLPNGKVLFWEWWIKNQRGTKASLWDPATDRFTRLPYQPSNHFCGGHSFLPDGRLFVSGGTYGTKTTSFFDPRKNRWVRGPVMNAPRYYPTNTTLPNGEVLISAGLILDRGNPLPQVLTRTGKLRDLTRAKRDIHYYPQMHVAPNGKVFMAGPSRETSYLNTAGKGKWEAVAVRNFGKRDYGTSVMYADGKVISLGGGDPPTSTAEVIDLNDPAPAWRPVTPMAWARRHVNATILPDGKLFINGGTYGPGKNNPNTPVYPAEIWNPQTEAFTTVASAAEPRMDHSTAILMPDGRVMTAGGEEGDTSHFTSEFYSPPYLFRGTRPQITSAPTEVRYGQSFPVATPDATSIGSVSLVRLSSVTHAFNMGQRIVRPTFSASETGLEVQAPSNRNLCPPGHYMLFILNGSGVPSVARIVRVS